MKGPRLPARARKECARQSECPQQAPNLQAELHQQLNSNPAFKQFVDQPEKLLAVLQNDRVLADAAQGNPEIAALLDPSTLKQALGVLQGAASSPGHEQQQQQQQQQGFAAPVVQRKALMALQNYAMQLQHARASGVNTAALHQQQFVPGLDGSLGGGGNAAAAGRVGVADNNSNGMWTALQQRLNKLQQRSSMLGAMQLPQGAVPSPLALQQHTSLHQQHAQQSLALPLQQQHQQQPHPQPQPLQQQQQPQQPGHSLDSLQQQHQQQQAVTTPHCKRLTEVAGWSSAHHSSSGGSIHSPGSGLGAAGGGTSPRAARLARLTMPDGLGGVALSPLGPWGGGGGGGGMSPSVDGFGPLTSSSSQCFSPGVPGALQRRSSSSLSHRLLRHATTASPMTDLTDLQRSGSHALNIERLESGDVIVDITPPTRITQELSWSTDPTAAYVMDATSPSFTQLPPSVDDSSSSNQLFVGSTLPEGAFQAYATSAAAGAAMGGAPPAAADSQPHPSAFPLFGDGVAVQQDAESNTANAAVRAAAGSSTHVNSTAAGGFVALAEAADAAKQAVARSVSATSSGGPNNSSSRLTPSPKKQLHVRVPSTGYGTQQQQQQQQQQPVDAWQHLQQAQQQQQQQQTEQQQQEDHYSYIDLSNAAAGPGATVNAAAVADGSSAQRPQPQQQQQRRQRQYDGDIFSEPAAGSLYGAAATAAATGTAAAGGMAGAAATAAASGAALDARTYYESVAPSTWRPTDVGGDPGDYLELYRRAYCSYADALFPPVWIALIATLCSLQLLPLWLVCVVGVVSFWGGMWLMAIKWAGVPPAHLGLSRVTPVLTVCLELLCTGAFVLRVLPVMWLGHSLACCTLLVCSVSTLALHLTAYLQDPGYTPLPDAEEGMYARHLAATSPKRANTQGPAAAATGSSTHASASSGGKTSAQAASEQTPLLAAGANQQHQQQQQGVRSGAPGAAAAGAAGAAAAWSNGQPMDHCWTCRVKRNLRSKHCPLCKRCVERFCHHCPVLGNCVGAGNQKTFVVFLAAMLLSQLLFCHLLTGMLTQTYLQQVSSSSSAAAAAPHSNLIPAVQAAAAAAGGGAAGSSAGAAAHSSGSQGSSSSSGDAVLAQAGGGTAADAVVPATTGAAGADANKPTDAAATPVAVDAGKRAAAAGADDSSWLVMLQALWAAGSSQMGMLLLLVAQVPTMMMSSSLLFRALGLAAANLTVNEWVNRHRYVHLHYTGAGFSNRFDRGVAANCYDFWCGPKLVDYWHAWDTADQEMRNKGLTVLVPWSPSVLIRLWDLRWSQYQQRLLSSRQRRRDVQMARRMAALGLTAQQH